MLKIFLSALLSLALTAAAFAQSQAINGTIEGTVSDSSGGVLPGVTVTIANIDTGAERSVVTNETGLYRAPLLQLGNYRVIAELQGFKKFEQSGVTLSAGQTAVVNVTLGVGQITEVVSVTGDSPIVDLGKIDQGRTLNEREIKSLPLTSRNPYNFALLQPGVTGFETQEFGVPRITANGALLRVNYQIDGNDNTEKDRAGLRQMPMSEVMIREVKVVTTGYAPEFGQTMGLVYNAITPSGSNLFKGQASYRFQRKSFAALPFFATSSVKPPTEVNVFTVDNGGPIVKDKTFISRDTRTRGATFRVAASSRSRRRTRRGWGSTIRRTCRRSKTRSSRSARLITSSRRRSGSASAISFSTTSSPTTSAAASRPSSAPRTSATASTRPRASSSRRSATAC